MGKSKEQITDIQLKYATEKELASVMMDMCARHIVDIHDNPRAKKTTWTEIERIAEEITRRKNIKKEP